MPTGKPRHAGFTYVGLLIVVVLFGLASVGAARILASSERAEREKQLLFVGHQFRQAIQSYYGVQRRYPEKLEDLLADPRSPTTIRHLRRIYDDPITGKTEWGAIKAPEGGIMGVHSLSEREPLKRANFDPEDIGFDELIKRSGAGGETPPYRYRDWEFVYQPNRAAAQTAPGNAATRK